MDGENDVRIGVFICDCGRKIADRIDVAELEKSVADTPGVVLAQRELYSCSKKGLRDIQRAITEHGLTHAVVSGCTPRTHEPLFKAALEEAGLRPSLLEMANIREHCALVHSDDTGEATKKALDLTRMGVAKVALLQPREELRVDVTPGALVIGGGIAGLTAALAVGRGGFPVKLVEKERHLGGLVARLHTLYPSGQSAREFIEKRIRGVEDHPAVEVLHGARVADVTGSVGNYQITVEQANQTSEFSVGAVIVAIGAQESKPIGVFGHDGAKVITQLQLEQALQEDSVEARRVVIVLDSVDSPNHALVAAAAALKNSIALKRRDPEAEVSVLFENLTADIDARKIREARESGVHFVRYGGRDTPKVTGEAVEVYDHLRGEEVSIPYDLVVLALPLAPHDDAARMSFLLKTPLDDSGFFLEPSLRLRPGTYAPNGVFVCGSAHYPADVNESVFQAHRAAARTLHYLSDGHLGSQAPPAIVNESLCTGCGSCVEACAFLAITMAEREGTLNVSRIDPSLCKRCGNCSAVCPARAIHMEPYTDRQLIAQIDAALAQPSNSQPRILALLCEWSGYAAADLSGAEGRQYPSSLRIIGLGCSARFDPYHILWSFLQGADGVLLGACDPGMCHYVDGNQYAKERVERLQEMLRAAGFDARRLRLQWFKPDDAQKFVEVVKEFADEIGCLGPAAPY